ncbi:hypothetical protein, partial [Pseudomonas fluorescens]|uniref:hypothetical protein n=1 Tax=Pseudomonas fluorescens TaxID=294 RepID=UPI001CA6E330
VYDKAQANDFRFDGSVWASATGVWVGRASIGPTNGTVDTSFLGSTGATYFYSATVAPTTSQRRATDVASALTYSAKKTSALLRFQYNADCNFAPGASGVATNNRPAVLALFRDSESNAIAWKMIPFVVDLTFANILASNVNLNDAFEIAATDTA